MKHIPDPLFILIRHQHHDRLLEQPLILQEEECEEGYSHEADNHLAQYGNNIPGKIGNGGRIENVGYCCDNNVIQGFVSRHIPVKLSQYRINLVKLVTKTLHNGTGVKTGKGINLTAHQRDENGKEECKEPIEQQ